VGLDASRSQVWLHLAQVNRMQREKVCGPVLDEQLRTLAGVLGEHLEAVRLEQLNGYLYGKEAA
jgi:hypothetical protein